MPLAGGKQPNNKLHIYTLLFKECNGFGHNLWHRHQIDQTNTKTKQPCDKEMQQKHNDSQSVQINKLTFL